MHSSISQVYTQVYSCRTRNGEGVIQPYRPFRARVLLIKPDDVNQTFEMFAGNIMLFMNACPVSQFLMVWYNLLVGHAFRENWEEERLNLALARFSVHAPAVSPGSQYTFRLHGEGEAAFTLIGSESCE